MPLYPPPPPSPYYLSNDGQESMVSGIAVLAGSVYLYPIRLDTPTTVLRMRTSISSGVPTGNVDMGIYDSSGANRAPNTLLGSTGVVVAATGVFTQNLTANLLLQPGLYWIALVDTVADQFYGRAANQGSIPAMRTQATTHSFLPTSIGVLQSTGYVLQVGGLVSNGWT